MMHCQSWCRELERHSIEVHDSPAIRSPNCLRLQQGVKGTATLEQRRGRSLRTLSIRSDLPDSCIVTAIIHFKQLDNWHSIEVQTHADYLITFDMFCICM